MKKLDWYILKKLISTTLFILLMMSAIACIIDASEKTDDFVKAGVTTYQIITQYYAGFVPFIISMIFPLMVFIGVIFFTSKMAGRSEIVAIIASGVHFNRFLRPYLIGAFILFGSQINILFRRRTCCEEIFRQPISIAEIPTRSASITAKATITIYGLIQTPMPD
jgi:lipopolysaccharide export LptBFGC system permease protein LptF